MTICHHIIEKSCAKGNEQLSTVSGDMPFAAYIMALNSAVS